MEVRTRRRPLTLAAVLVAVLALAACTQDFWDRSPKVGATVQPTPWTAPSASPAPAEAQAAPSPRPAPSARPVPAAAAPGTGAIAGGPAAEDAAVLEIVNGLRRARGLRALRFHPALFLAARAHSEEQQRFGYMGHGSPDPARRTLVQRIEAEGYQGRAYGEVVAWGYPDAAAVVEGWMNSRTHRQVLMDARMTDGGFSRVGSYWSGNLAAPLGAGAPAARARLPGAGAAPSPTWTTPAPSPSPAPGSGALPSPRVVTSPEPAPSTRRHFEPAPRRAPAPPPSRPRPRGG